MAATASLMISAVKSQPQISEKSQTISTARWVMERLTREIRNGIAVDPEKATASEVSFTAYVGRRPAAVAGTLAGGSKAIPCQVTYRCTTTECSRIEAAPGVFTGHRNDDLQRDRQRRRLQLHAERRPRQVHRSHAAVPEPERQRRPDHLRRRQPAQREPRLLMSPPTHTGERLHDRRSAGRGADPDDRRDGDLRGAERGDEEHRAGEGHPGRARPGAAGSGEAAHPHQRRNWR